MIRATLMMIPIISYHLNYTATKIVCVTVSEFICLLFKYFDFHVNESHRKQSVERIF